LNLFENGVVRKSVLYPLKKIMNKLLTLSSTLLLCLTLATPSFARGRNITATGGGGRTLSVNNYTNRTGPGTYSRYGNYTGTGVNGGTRSGTYTGTGTY
jgi:hypothetical protein